jgi:hypothetical protein
LNKGLEDPKEVQEREKSLQEEAVVRGRVKPIFTQLTNTISTLVAIADARPSALDSILFVVVPQMLKLLPSEDFEQFLSENITLLSLRCFKHEFARSVGKDFFFLPLLSQVS